MLKAATRASRAIILSWVRQTLGSQSLDSQVSDLLYALGHSDTCKISVKLA